MNDNGSLPPRRATRAQAAAAPRAPKSRRKPRRILRIVLSLFAVMIIVLGVYVGYLILKVQDNIGKIADDPPTETSYGGGITDNTDPVPSEESARKKAVGILLMGLDTRAETGGLNTDVMMVALFNPESKTATVVSIPRDSDLNLSGYKTQKANGFYAGFLRTARVDKKLEGTDAKRYANNQMKEMMEKFLDVPVNYTVTLDFQGFVDVVDALGGVNVYVDQNMRYWDKADGTDINLTKGDHKLNGEDALGFVRYRKSRDNLTPESSDFQRNDRQDRVLGAILDKLKSLGSITKLGGVLDAIGNNVKSDIPEAQITNMIATYFGITKKDVRFIALTGEWKSPYVYLDQDKLKEAKQALQEELRPEGRTLVAASETQPSEQASGNN